MRSLPALLSLLLLLSLGCDESPTDTGNGPGLSSARTQDLVWTAAATVYDVAPSRLRVTVTGRNVGTKEQSITYGACNVRIQLYSATTATLSWDSAYKWDTYGTPRGCILPLYVKTIQPGDTVNFAYEIEVPDLMADSVADGNYDVGVAADFGFEPRDSSFKGMGFIRAGRVSLVRKQEPLPTQRVVDSVAYTASTSKSGSQVTATLTARNIAHSARRIVITDTVPFSIYGYSTVAERDRAWYWAGTQPKLTAGPHWILWRYYDLAAGESRSFTFSTETSAMAKPTTPAGTYAFAAAVWQQMYHTVLISAGEVTLP